MQTSSRDGDVHSFAHVIPACRLAGWLVVIGGAAERTTPAHDLLAGPDLGNRPVTPRIKVDAQGLLMRIRFMSADGELGHPSPCLLTRPAVTVCHPCQRATLRHQRPTPEVY